jgi:hypothetical protein
MAVACNVDGTSCPADGHTYTCVAVSPLVAVDVIGMCVLSDGGAPTEGGSPSDAATSSDAGTPEAATPEDAPSGG